MTFATHASFENSMEFRRSIFIISVISVFFQLLFWLNFLKKSVIVKNKMRHWKRNEKYLKITIVGRYQTEVAHQFTNFL